MVVLYFADQATVSFANTFTISKGTRGNCDAIIANADIYIDYDECKATVSFSNATDAQKLFVKQQCN